MIQISYFKNFRNIISKQVLRKTTEKDTSFTREQSKRNIVNPGLPFFIDSVHFFK